jgi:putative molybdopterin biosynthesis protein
LPSGAIYDSNGAIIAAAVTELGGEPIPLGAVGDDEQALQQVLDQGLQHDMVILSGGTSKGAGDLSYHAVSRLQNPGIVVHGVALKPGKPICLAVTEGKPVIILPGFPTSAIFTFHEFVAPVIRRFAGLPPARRETVSAVLPVRAHSERGRTEYLLVSLVQSDNGLAAYPIGKGSGAVTTFSYADGFIAIPQHTEFLEAGSTVAVQLIGQKLEPAELVFIGSHCVGLDYLMGRLQARGITVKTISVGSMGGLTAAKRGECDIAGIHLMDPETEQYNRHLLTDDLELIPGYRRLQGVVFREDDSRFAGKTPEQAVAAALQDVECTMVNRNAGSGTRILIDKLLAGQQPPGYGVQTKSHNAVAAAVVQHRADWGIAIDTVARQYGLGFIPLQEEHYDFIVPKQRLERPAVRYFRELLEDPQVKANLSAIGFKL